MICSFCGKTFEEVAGREACSRCALFGGCRNVRCPYCGYESPLEPKSVSWLRGQPAAGAESQAPPRGGQATCAEPVVPAATADRCAEIKSLAQGRTGQTGIVSGIDAGDDGGLRKILALGLLPGDRLRLLQTSPAFILQVGFSQFSLDRELAGAIRVCWE